MCVESYDVNERYVEYLKKVILGGYLGFIIVILGVGGERERVVCMY